MGGGAAAAGLRIEFDYFVSIFSAKEYWQEEGAHALSSLRSYFLGLVLSSPSSFLLLPLVSITIVHNKFSMVSETEQCKTPALAEEDEPTLLRGWSNDDDLISIAQTEEEGLVNDAVEPANGVPEENKDPKFKPGDHVIRWKIMKALLWPIQIHAIVLSADVDDDGICSIVIADFGYSSTEDGKKKKGLKAINDLMRNFYDGKKDEPATAPELDKGEQEAEDDEEDGKDRKRFHTRKISDPDILKKWSKVNYGQSLFSSKGKLDKLKKLFKIPQKKKDDKSDDESATVDDQSTSMFDENDDFFKSSAEGGLHTVKESTDNDPLAAIKKVLTPPRSNVKQPSVNYNNLSMDDDDADDDASIDSIEELVAQANAVERRTRPRSKVFPFRSSRSADDSSVTSFESIRSAASNRSIRPIAGMNNLFKKISFHKNNKSEEYDTVSKDGQPAKSAEGPKLPKSDPRTVVLARVNHILAEQDKPEDETSLPKYHILYSNSECLAVWCKTGRFSTLQAAVFLHSTAVGNAKSSFLLGAGIAATQPWLIPVVGVYAVAAVGMPYYILKKCKDKWKESEMKLTTSFWANASSAVFVAAIENWSGLTPEMQEDSDEIGADTAAPQVAEDNQAPLIEQV